jgi:hypothetical protein
MATRHPGRTLAAAFGAAAVLAAVSIAYDPYVQPARAAQLGVRLVGLEAIEAADLAVDRDPVVGPLGRDEFKESPGALGLMRDEVADVPQRRVRRGGEGVDRVHVLLEHRDRERDAVGEVAVERTLTHSGPLGHG